MSIEAVSWAYSVKAGSPTNKAVLVCLCEFANAAADAWPSIATICDRTEFADKPVRRALAALSDAGFITIDRRNGAGSRYKINVGFCLEIKQTPVSKTAVTGTAVGATAVSQTKTPVSPTGTAVSPTNRTVNNLKEPLAAKPSVSQSRYPFPRQEAPKPGKQIIVAKPDETGKLCVNGWYIEQVFDKVLYAARINHDRFRGDYQPIAQWLMDDYEPEAIYKAVERCAARDNYEAPGSLAYFDKVVRGSAYVRAA